MSLSRLWSGIKGIVNKEIEDAADKNAIPELQQNIREAKTEIKTLDTNIAQVRGERKMADKEVDAIKAKISSYEQNVREFAASENMEMATKVAGEIGKQRPILATTEQRRDVILANEQKLISVVQDLKCKITEMEQQMAQIESTELLQKAQSATLNVTTGLNSKAGNALEALERTKARQAKRAAQLEAATELADEAKEPQGLDAEIAAAKSQSSSTANDELARILEGAK